MLSDFTYRELLETAILVLQSFYIALYKKGDVKKLSFHSKECGKATNQIKREMVGFHFRLTSLSVRLDKMEKKHSDEILFYKKEMRRIKQAKKTENDTV